MMYRILRKFLAFVIAVVMVVGLVNVWVAPELKVRAEGGVGEGGVTILATSGYSFAIRNDGSLWAWGSNWSGQLGDGTTTDQHSPVFVLDDVFSVSASVFSSSHGSSFMAVRYDGSLYAWGSGVYCQLSNRHLGTQHYPVQIWDGVLSVSVGTTHTMVIRADNSLWGWGEGRLRLGMGSTSPLERGIWTEDVRWHWDAVPIMEDVVFVSAGHSHTMAIRSDGSLWAWGLNNRGQLGNGTTTNQYTPVIIMENVAFVSAVGNYTMAIKNDGSLWACA